MGVSRLPKFFGYPLLSQERVKLRTSNFVGTFIGSIRTKGRKNVGNSSRGHSQGVPKISGHPCNGMYRAHCAVIFAIAQLSCTYMATPQLLGYTTVNDLGHISRSLDCFTSNFSKTVCDTAKVTIDN